MFRTNRIAPAHSGVSTNHDLQSTSENAILLSSASDVEFDPRHESHLRNRSTSEATASEWKPASNGDAPYSEGTSSVTASHDASKIIVRISDEGNIHDQTAAEVDVFPHAVPHEEKVSHGVDPVAPLASKDTSNHSDSTNVQPDHTMRELPSLRRSPFSVRKHNEFAAASNQQNDKPVSTSSHTPFMADIAALLLERSRPKSKLEAEPPLVLDRDNRDNPDDQHQYIAIGTLSNDALAAEDQGTREDKVRTRVTQELKHQVVAENTAAVGPNANMVPTCGLDTDTDLGTDDDTDNDGGCTANNSDNDDDNNTNNSDSRSNNNNFVRSNASD
eukprot:m.72517 g.72517  ORF g.72517 m.72517 type:complete len:331 (-) comp24460_c0_seq1:61-1053(-)